jgi:hypothetical protein
MREFLFSNTKLIGIILKRKMEFNYLLCTARNPSPILHKYGEKNLKRKFKITKFCSPVSLWRKCACVNPESAPRKHKVPWKRVWIAQTYSKYKVDSVIAMNVCSVPMKRWLVSRTPRPSYSRGRTSSTVGIRGWEVLRVSLNVSLQNRGLLPL